MWKAFYWFVCNNDLTAPKQFSKSTTTIIYGFEKSVFFRLNSKTGEMMIPHRCAVNGACRFKFTEYSDCANEKLEQNNDVVRRRYSGLIGFKAFHNFMYGFYQLENENKSNIVWYTVILYTRNDWKQKIYQYNNKWMFSFIRALVLKLRTQTNILH